MQVTIINETFDFDGDSTGTETIVLNAWRVIPFVKAFEFDGRQFLSSWQAFFKNAPPELTQGSKIVINSKEYEIISFEQHYDLDGKTLHHTKIVV